MVERKRLSNGLTVVFECQHVAPVAAFQVWVKVGSGDETPAQVGLAHLHEHMLFKGTATRGPGDIARSVEARGGAINAWTSHDQTVYHVVQASRHAREGLEVLADAVRNSAFDPTELEREIEVVCEEIKRSLDMPSRRASKQLFADAFGAHPYGRPVIGFEASVRAHTREGVLGFYGTHYTPSNIVLGAVGDFTREQVLEWTEALFGGDWGRPATVAPPRPVESPFTGVKVNLVRDEVKEAHLHLAFQIPGLAHPDTPALDLLAMLAGQGDASRLALEVRRKRSLAREVSAWAWTPKDPGLFAASLVAEPQTLLAGFEETARVLAMLTAEEVPADELATVKALVESEAVYSRETVQGLARKVGFYEAVAGGIEQEARYYEAIAQVTPARVREVAKQYLTFDRAVVTGLVPSEATVDAEALTGVLGRVAQATPTRLPARQLAPTPPFKVLPSNRDERPGLTVETLPSGATIIVREERAAPLFSMRAAFPGGLRYETDAASGLTALLSRTLRRGTASLEPEALSHLLDSLAGGLGAVGGRNSMGLRAEFLSRHFDRAFDLLAEVLKAPAFPEAEVARERQQLLQDIAARDDRPAAVVMDLFSRTLYRAHPYRLPGLGERTSLSQLGREALLGYHRAYMDTSQLTLSVVGDVDTPAVLAKAREAFGAAKGGTPAPAVAVEPDWDGPREARRTLNKAQSHLVLGFVGARITDTWRRSLEVLATLLAGQSGRLFLELRDKRSMAYSVSAMTMEGVDPGSFAVYMATSPEKVEPAVVAIREELDRVRQERVSDAELDRAREYLIGTHQIGLQRNAARAGLMALDACYGLGAEYSANYAQEVAQVTVEQVREVAQRVINFEKSALVVVGP